jgi:hypothetical protein
MRKFLFGALLLPVLALAEPVTVDKPVVCERADIVIKELLQRFKEVPVWQGDDPENPGSRYALLLNKENFTWTLLQYSDRIACVLGSGEGFRIPVTPESNNNL